MILIFLIALITIVLGVFEWRKSTNKKEYLIKNSLYLILSLIFLFLFGPLFGLSPIKIGYQTEKISNITIIFPKGWQDEKEEFAQLIDQAEQEVLTIFPQQLPATLILPKNNFDLFRFTGQRRGGNNSLKKIYISRDSMDRGVITHELTHHYLHQTITGPSFSIPRWFDEGLATYLGDSDSMARFTQTEALKKLLNDGRYPKNLDCWNGFAGQLKWMWQIYRGGYVSHIYTHSYYLVRFLIEEYGVNKLQAFIKELESNSSFENAFQNIYDLSVKQFGENFIDSSQQYLQTNLLK